MVESLELRRLLASVTGTAGNDTITVAIVSPNIVITVNGTPNNFTDTANTTITVNGGDGNDTITVSGNSDNLTTINGGIGDDSIVVGGGDYDNNINSGIAITGGAGAADLVRVNDLADGPGSDTTNITGSSYVKLFGGTLSWDSAVESLIVDASANPDTINVLSTTATTAQTINGGGGNDSILVGGNDYDLNIQGPITVNGDAGTDKIVASDEADTGNDTYTLDTTFTKNSGGSVLTPVAERLDISGPFAVINSTFNLFRYTAGLVIAGGGDGNDTFNVGGGDYDTNFDAVEIQGDAGVDVINYDDSLDSGGISDTYDIFATSIQKGALANTLTYSTTVEGVVITGATANDLFNVNSTSATIPITINAGDGNDTLDVGGAANDIDSSLNAATTFNGGAGIDRIDLNDTGDTADNDSYTLGSGNFSKTGSAVLSLDATSEVFELDANAGDNGFTFGSLFAGDSFAVLAGGGNDTFNVSNVNFIVDDAADLVLNGGVGSNTVNFIDTGDLDASAYTLTGSTFQVTGGNLSGLITYVGFAALTFTGGNAGTIFNLNAYGASALTLDMGGGDDTLSVGGGDLDNNIGSNLTLAGGTGNDSLVINDATDGPGADVLSFDNNVTTKNGRTITYSAFETQLSLNSPQATTVNINAVNIPTSITGGNGAETFITTAVTQDLDNISAPITVNGNGGNDTLTLNDTLDTGDDTYFLDFLNVTKPGAGLFAGLIYGGLELLNLFANGLNDTIDINGSPPNTNIHVDAGAGNDTINPGGPDAFSATVDLIGGSGADVMNFNDQAYTSGRSYFLTNIRVQRSPGLEQSVFFDATIESVVLNAGSGDDTINVVQLAADSHTINAGNGNDTISLGDGTLGGATSLLATTQIFAGNGADLVNVGAGDLDELVGTVLINMGGSGTTETIIVNDSADSGTLATNYAIGDVSFTRSGAGTSFGGLTFLNESAIRFSLNQAGTPVTIDDTPGGNSINGGIVETNGGTDSITVVNAPVPITIRGGTGVDSIDVNSDSVDVANVVFDTNESFFAISNRNGGLLTFAGDIAIRAQLTSIATTGVIDFTRATLVVPASNLASYKNSLDRGFNGGGWNGSANGSFRSSVAASTSLGDALGYSVIGTATDQLNTTSVHGVGVVAGDLVVTYTLGGDADLDRDVDFADLLSVAQNFNAALGGKNWRQGNFNYNTPDAAIAAVGFPDLLLLAQNVGQPLPLSSGLGTSVNSKNKAPRRQGDTAT